LSNEDREFLIWDGEEISDDLFNEAFATFDSAPTMPDVPAGLTGLTKPEVSVQRSPSVKVSLVIYQYSLHC